MRTCLNGNNAEKTHRKVDGPSLVDEVASPTHTWWWDDADEIAGGNQS